MMLINGVPAEQIAATDRGLHFGDGLFETIAVRHGQLLLWRRHWRRLVDGCVRLGLPVPDENDMLAEARAVCAGRERAVVKIIVTRGAGDRGYRMPGVVAPNRVVLATAWPVHPASHATAGVVVRVCSMRLGRNRLLAGIKHLNRLEQVLARAEWSDESVAEGLLLDDSDHVIEATAANVFFVHGTLLVTPSVVQCGIAGVIRELILERAARLGFAVRVGAVTLADVWKADEIFLTNSVIGVWPVRRVECGQIAYAKQSTEIARTVAADIRACSEEEIEDSNSG